MYLSGRKLGDFVLREPIGEGGCAVVYRCEQPQLRRSAVVKVLHERGQRSDAALDRFRREAQLASQLDHPYAAHVYAFGDEDDGLFWIAMELVQGTALDDWLETHGPMPLAQFVPFFECVADVVHAAHERGIIHRDLKPSNVMVIDRNGRLFPKLLDFGIAKLTGELALPAPEHPAGTEAVTTAPLRAGRRRAQRTRTDPAAKDHRLTRTSAKLGSTAYMSPEQWTDPQSVGAASDIYSLGVLAYEVLTGRKPFTANSTHEYYHAHVHAEAPPLGDGFPPEVDRVIRRALAKSPEARHGNALDLAAELRAVLRLQPHEQLRAAAQQWEDRARSPDLLWGRRILTDVESSVPPKTMSELECSFVAASHRRARRRAWMLRILVGALACGAIGVLAYQSTMRARLAEQRASIAQQQARAEHEIKEARITESELEQGRSALLHGEPEAQRHLAEAYRRDPAPTTAFMLARAMQPRLSELARLQGTYGRMWWATFSPDGRRIVTADDRAAQVWDAKTYRLLFTLPHGCEVYQAVYSPDGTSLVTVAQTMVRIWDARTGALRNELRAKSRQASSDFYRAAISADSRFVAAIDEGGTLVWVWDTEHGVLVAELPGRAAGFPRLAFSVDGRLATTGGEEARIFDPHGWKQVLSIPGPILSLEVDARSRLVTGSATGEVAVWDVRRASRLRQLRPFGEPVDAVAFSADGTLVAAGSRDGTLQVWQADSGALRTQLNPRHGKILWVEFDPTAASLLAAHADGTVVVADVAQRLPIATLDGPTNAVRVARFDTGSRIVGASWDGAARVWEATSPYRRSATDPVGDDCSVGLGSRPDRRFIAVGCRDRPTRVWDTAHDRMLAELPSSTPLNADGFISAAPAVSSAGDLAAVPRGTTTAIYELPGGRLLRTLEHGAAVSAIAFADSGRAMVSGALDGSVHVLREDGTELMLQASAGISAAAFLPDGRVLVADAERHLRTFAADGTVLSDLSLPVRVMSLERAAARLVALPTHGVEAGPPLLIDLDAFRIVAPLEGHVGQVFSARWVPGNRVLTAGADGTARLWDGLTGRLLQTYKGGPRVLGDATLLSDLVVGGDADGLLRFWDPATGAKLWTLPVHKSAVIGVHLEGTDIVTRGFTGEISRWQLPRSEAMIAACARHSPCAIVP
jgi:WD40 repeat protein/serine/threonine protein kinase